MAQVDILITGYAKGGDGADSVQPTITLVRDQDIILVVDPGMLADVEDLHRALREHNLTVDDVTHIFLTHQHVDHTRNIGLFKNAKVYDYLSTYEGDQWGEHDGDGFQLSPDVSIIHTPGHTSECASLVVQTDEGVVVMTHAWWFADMTPTEDPLAEDQEQLEKSRQRILEEADRVIPGHGPEFTVQK